MLDETGWQESKMLDETVVPVTGLVKVGKSLEHTPRRSRTKRWDYVWKKFISLRVDPKAGVSPYRVFYFDDIKEAGAATSYIRDRVNQEGYEEGEGWYAETTRDPKNHATIMVRKVSFPVVATETVYQKPPEDTDTPAEAVVSVSTQTRTLEDLGVAVSLLRTEVQNIQDGLRAHIDADNAADFAIDERIDKWALESVRLDERIDKWALEPTEVSEVLNGEVKRLDARIDRVAVALSRV